MDGGRDDLADRICEAVELDMAHFPVRYAQEGPPAAGPSVRAHLDTDVGAGMLWEGVARAGSDLAKVGERIQLAEDAVALSTLKRKADERRTAAWETMQGIQDPEGMQKAWEKAKGEIESLGASAPKHVADAYKLHINEALPHWEWQAKNQVRETRIDRATDAMTQNLEHYIVSGDKKTYATEVYKAQALKLITPEKGAYLIENYDATHDLRLMERLLDRGDPGSLESAIQIGAEYQKEELAGKEGKLAHKVSGELRAGLRRAYQAAGRAQKEAMQELVTKAVFAINDAKGMPAAEQGDALEGVWESLRGLPISPEEARVMRDRIDKTLAGKDLQTNPFVYGDVYEQISSLTTASPPEEVAAAKSILADAIRGGQLSTTDATDFMRMLGKLPGREMQAAVKTATARAVRDRQVEPGADAATFSQTLLEKATTEKLSAQQTVLAGAGLQATWPTRNVKAPTLAQEERRQRLLGRFQTETYQTFLGEFIAFKDNPAGPEKVAQNLLVEAYGPWWRTFLTKEPNGDTYVKQVEAIFKTKKWSLPDEPPPATSAVAPAPVAGEKPVTAFNPTTGEWIIQKDGKWQRLKPQ